MTARVTERIVYTNPVYPHYFADPFVLKVGRMYYAYGTAPADAQGRQFPVLRSQDLAKWEYAGHALGPLNNPPAYTYWAPEVAEKDGRFYLFYSATTSQSDEHHRLRVAVADRPEGPFRDSGKLLLPDAGFTIDPSPFRDPQTGKWFLYFATDYTKDEPHGTGLAVAPLSDDLMEITGQPRCVVRARCDWQIYERNRNYKGRTWKAWHCVEGPFTVFHQGRYYCLYSAGAWYTENYGIGFAVAEDPMGPFRDELAERGPTVLRGVPNEVLGPGHASVTLGPDNRTQMLVYHAWNVEKSARRMCMDPLIWTAAGPKCDGPSTTPRSI